MVLQEALNEGETFTRDDTAPTDSADPYSTSPTPSGDPNTQTYHIKMDALPKPLIYFGAQSDANIAQTIIRNCQHASSVLSRPLKQEEVDAIGYHFSKSLRIVSYGVPVGGVLGSWYFYRGMSTFRFPFWTPKEGGRFDPNAFGPMRGQAARALWHSVRFNLYAFGGVVASTIFFSTYATSTNAVGAATDPRLQEYLKALQERSKGMRENAQRPVGQRNPIGSQEGQLDNQAQRAARRLGVETEFNRQDVQRRPSSYYFKPRDADDDGMSPTSGTWAQENEGVHSDAGLLSDDQMQQQMQREERRQQGAAADRANQQSRYSDVASPTSNSSQSQGSGRTSAWDRIRSEATTAASRSTTNATQRGQARPGAGQVQNEQRAGASVGDSFSFSDTDEERQLAKSEAQREFDARVERERRGGDFGAEDRRWR